MLEGKLINAVATVNFLNFSYFTLPLNFSHDGDDVGGFNKLFTENLLEFSPSLIKAGENSALWLLMKSTFGFLKLPSFFSLITLFTDEDVGVVVDTFEYKLW